MDDKIKKRSKWLKMTKTIFKKNTEGCKKIAKSFLNVQKKAKT